MTRLEEIKARADAATIGPWVANEDEDGDIANVIVPDFKKISKEDRHKTSTGCDEDDSCYHEVCRVPVEKYSYGSAWASRENADFIAHAHARADVPWLLEKLEMALELMVCTSQRCGRYNNLGKIIKCDICTFFQYQFPEETQ